MRCKVDLTIAVGRKACSGEGLQTLLNDGHNKMEEVEEREMAGWLGRGSKDKLLPWLQHVDWR